MLKVVDLESSFRKFNETFTPKIVGELNGQHVKLVHLEGDKVPWHIHFCIVPRGLEHRVVPQGHVRLMLFEPAGIAHTGKVQAEITKDHYDWLE